jgi:uncharacterized protein YndB with AHSA1/START domain
MRSIEEQVLINAPASAVWEALTHVERMKEWMGEPEMHLKIETDWRVGNKFVVRGNHHGHFQNTGIVRDFDPMRRLAYTHLSSLSQLPDNPENHATIGFQLVPVENATSLTLSITSPRSATIFEHLQFYWRGTLQVLKQYVEHAAVQ